VEDALGRARFLGFYLAAGVAAALVQVVASAMTGDVLVPMVGASGAIAGVLAGYMILFPRARVLTLVIIVVFIRILPLPAGWFIGVWFAGQLLSVLLGANTGVAFFAHIGGFLAGLLLVKVVGRRPGFGRRPRAYW
jgi:membrane associated rhomboid family serine protease